MQQHMVGEGTHVLQPDTSHLIFLSFVFPVSASRSFQLIPSFYLFLFFFLLHSASFPHLCQTCMQSGLCKYSCTQACKTIWISRSTIRDGTLHVPHAHAHKERGISQCPSPFFLSFWPDTALGSIPRADPLVGTLM